MIQNNEIELIDIDLECLIALFNNNMLVYDNLIQHIIWYFIRLILCLLDMYTTMNDEQDEKIIWSVLQTVCKSIYKSINSFR
jgi:hypothetical protein